MIRTRIFFQLSAAVMVLIGLTVLVAQSLHLTDGQLFYTLDDPYIHLSVAESVLQGGYGVNRGEYASPSSSILYPFLLAAGLIVGLSDWTPLVLGALASTISAAILAGAVWRYAIDPTSGRSILVGWLCLPLLLLAMNAYALPLTGMEHSLHVLATVAVIAGLADLSAGRGVAMSLVLGVLFAPLLRFEGLALSGMAILALAWWGQWRTGALLGIGIAAALVSWVAVMQHLGLPALPSSVMVKSQASASALDAGPSSFLASLIDNLRETLLQPSGSLLWMGAGLCLIGLADPSRTSATRLTVGLVVAPVLIAHLVLGKMGWFGRYEVYAVAAMLLGLATVFGPIHPRSTISLGAFAAGCLMVLAVVARPYIWTTTDTPKAAQNIYAQQYQMYRFATEFFPHPVAVNDLGYVSYKNDVYVLDLWGLGSEEARKMNADHGRTASDLDSLATRHNVAYAMIYSDWFGDAVPQTWCRAAVLHTPRVTSARAEVDFYVIDPTYADQLDAALDRFASSLPAVNRIDRFDCPAAS